MSLMMRQVTCACCGKPFSINESVDIEPLVDSSIRYVLTHNECTTFPTPGNLTLTPIRAHTPGAEDSSVHM